MKVDELIQQSQIVTDYNGNKRSVLLEYSVWEELLETLETLENGAEVERVEPKPKDDSDNQESDWVTEALNKVYAEQDSSLDPVLAKLQWKSMRKVEW